jgi:hypothetical protein
VPIQKDFLERAIERLVQALAALLKLGRAGRTEEALAQLQQTGGELLGGMDVRVLRRMDPASVVRLLSPPEKVLLLARLVAAEAELHAAAGDAPRAARTLAEALGLLDAAEAPGLPPLAGADALRAEWTARRGALDAEA